jgi:hypothetical protein
MSETTRSDSNPSGPGTDAFGQEVKDPTGNVLDLVAAGNRRQDDLREMESEHVRVILAIREDHAKELRVAEAHRINAIRAVDVQAVQQAAQVQDTRATALAQQVADAAEAMRQQVAATATASATALATALQPITTSIEQLRQAMYEAQGQKTQVVETQARGANSGLWWGVAIAGVFGVLMFILAAITLAALVTHGFTQ